MTARKQSVWAAGLCPMLLILAMFLVPKPSMSADLQPSIDFVFVEEYPDYVTEDGGVHLRQDTGVNQPAPKYAGTTFLVRKNAGSEPAIRYIDERGWANDVHRDSDGNYYFMLRDDASDEHIYLAPNGRFPYIDIGKQENASLATVVLAYSKSVTQAQLDQCLEQARQGLLDPSSLVLTASLAADEEQVRDAPRRGLVFSSAATARNRCGETVPKKVSCFFRLEGAKPEFSHAYLSPN